MTSTFYDTLHIDTKEAFHRFLDNEALYLQMLKMFPDDPSFGQLKQAVKTHDLEGAFFAAHTLKGVAGSFALKRLYDLNWPIVEELRVGNDTHMHERFIALEQEYNLIVTTIKRELG